MNAWFCENEGAYATVFEAGSSVENAGIGLYNGPNWLARGDPIIPYGGRRVKLGMNPAPYTGENRYVMELEDFRIFPAFAMLSNQRTSCRHNC